MKLKGSFFVIIMLLAVVANAQETPDTLGIDDASLLPASVLDGLRTLDECSWPGHTFSTYDYTHDAVARGDRLYVVNHSNTTQTHVVYDISNPLNLSVTGYDDIGMNTAECIDATDFEVFIPDHSGYIHRFVVDPDLTGSPTSTYLTGQSWRDIKICGDIMFLLSAGRLYAYDISTGYSLLDYETTTSGSNKSFFVQGDYVFVAGGGSGFDIFYFDSDAGSFTDLGNTGVYNDNIWDVWANGELLYVADYNNQTIREYDIEDPTSPSYLRAIPAPGIGTGPTGVTGNGDYIYFTGQDATDGYLIAYNTQPDPIEEVGMDTWEGKSFRTTLHGMWAYIVTRDDLILSRQIADTLTSPENDKELPYPVSWIKVFGNVAYIADSVGCQIVGLDYPWDLSLEGHFGGGEYYWSLDICDHYLYLWDHQRGISVYDITDPLDPEYVTHNNEVSNVIGEIVVHQDHILLSGYKIDGVVTNEWNLYTFDISDREDPVLVNTEFIEELEHEWAFGLIEIAGNTAYLSLKDPPYWPPGTTPGTTADDNIIKTVGIEDPTAPTIEGDFHYSPYDYVKWAPIALDGYQLDYAMNWDTRGLYYECWEASDITTHSRLGRTSVRHPDAKPLAAMIWGNMFWVTVNNEVIRVEVTDPTSPEPVTVYIDSEEDMRLEHFDITDDWMIMVKNWYESSPPLRRKYYIKPIQIYDHQYCPGSKLAKRATPNLPAELAVCTAPNPFNASVSFSVSSSGGDCVIEVRDVLGRKVRTLCDEPLRRGTTNITWNGTDDTGQTLPSGVYYYTVKMDDVNRSGRLVLMK